MARLNFPMLQKLFQSAVCIGLMLMAVLSAYALIIAYVFSGNASIQQQIATYGFLTASIIMPTVLAFRMLKANTYHHYDGIALLVMIAAWWAVI